MYRSFNYSNRLYIPETQETVKLYYARSSIGILDHFTKPTPTIYTSSQIELCRFTRNVSNPSWVKAGRVAVTVVLPTAHSTANLCNLALTFGMKHSPDDPWCSRSLIAGLTVRKAGWAVSELRLFEKLGYGENWRAATGKILAMAAGEECCRASAVQGTLKRFGKSGMRLFHSEATKENR